MAKLDLNKSKHKSHQRTSIGFAANSRPKNKSKRRAWKAYRGQGK
jgi:hypothetical protein